MTGRALLTGLLMAVVMFIVCGLVAFGTVELFQWMEPRMGTDRAFATGLLITFVISVLLFAWGSRR